MSTTKCYCLSFRGNLHCPLTTDKSELERMFNYQVRGEAIQEVEVDNEFVCTNERKSYCKSCPFK